MSYKVLAIPNFSSELKRLVRKYPSLKKEIAILFIDLAINPKQGVSLGSNCFKIRLAISLKRSGKSGGARIITNLKISHAKVYMLSIYDKPEIDSISRKEIDDLVKLLPE